jgi:lipoyl(octanoyl) transferase
MSGVSHIPGRPLKASPPPFPVFDLGIAAYLPVQGLQRRLRAAVAEGLIPGVLLLLEHEPVITLGSRAGLQDLRMLRDSAALGPAGTAGYMARGIQVAESERGGQATLHAPGQLVSYPVVPIPGRDLGEYVRRLEEANLLTLADFGVRAARRPGHPGLYVAGDKISSVGLRCQRWVSSHGTSLNVSIDLSLFDAIVSCGEPQLRQTSIGRLVGTAPGMAEVKQAYVRAVEQVFGWELLPLRPLQFDQVEAELGLEGDVFEGDVSEVDTPADGMPTAGFEPATPGSGGQCSIP